MSPAPFDPTGLLPWLAGLLGAIGAWFAGLYKARLHHERDMRRIEAEESARRAAAPDPIAIAREAVADIVKHYRDALAASTEEIAGMRREIAELKQTIEALEAHVDELTSAMEQHGVPPPSRGRKRKESA